MNGRSSMLSACCNHHAALIFFFGSIAAASTAPFIPRARGGRAHPVRTPGNYEHERNDCSTTDRAGFVMPQSTICAYMTGPELHQRLQQLLGTRSQPSALRRPGARESTGFAIRPTMDLIRGLVALEDAHSIQAQEIAALLASKTAQTGVGAVSASAYAGPPPPCCARSGFCRGQAGHLELAPDIVPLLPDRNLRTAARRALGIHGAEIMDYLAAVLSDEDPESCCSMRNPWILSRIPACGMPPASWCKSKRKRLSPEIPDRQGAEPDARAQSETAGESGAR